MKFQSLNLQQEHDKGKQREPQVQFLILRCLPFQLNKKSTEAQLFNSGTNSKINNNQQHGEKKTPSKYEQSFI